MSARTKLNIAVVNGCLLIAAAAGTCCRSWTIFWVVGVLLIAGECYGGAIRPPQRPPRSRHR